MLQISSIKSVAKAFFVNPSKKYSLREISKEIKLAHTSVKDNLDKLVKMRLIIKHIEKKGQRKFPVYISNRDNTLFKKYKILANLSSIIESGLIELIDEKLAPKSLVLFGSYVRGEDTEDSDIDLFVECKEEKLNVKLFEKKLSRKIQFHFKENFNSYPKELKNNIINGLVLDGFLEGYK